MGTPTFCVPTTRPGWPSSTIPASTTGSSPSCSTCSCPETGLTFGWEPSLVTVTTRTLLESGSGLTRTRLSNGSTGLTGNLTTTTASTAWAWWRCTTPSTSTGTTTGTTWTVTHLTTTSVRRNVL